MATRVPDSCLVVSRRISALLIIFLAKDALAVCPVVDTAADAPMAPTGSLRQCLLLANATPGRDVITFDPALFPAARIQLAAPLPSVTEAVRIEGPVGGRVVIDGAATVDATGFDVRADGVELVRLEVRGFRGAGYGAGTGVFFRSVSRGVIEDCGLIGNQGGGVLFEGANGGHRLVNSTFEGNDVAGIRWYGPGTDCHAPRSTISGNVFRGNNPGNTSADDLAITFNGCIDVVENTFTQNRFFAVRLTGGASNVVIAGNEVLNATIGLFSGSRDNELRDNRFVHDAGDAIAIGDGNGSTNNRVVGNLFVGSGSAERGLYVYNLSSTTRVFHNTFSNYLRAGVVVDEVQTVDVRNNLFATMPAGVAGVTGPGSLVEFNGFSPGTRPCTDCDAGPSWFGDPGFVGPDTLTLQACGAGAIDRGVDLGALQPARAADGGRFFGMAPDLGAFESPCAAREEPDAGVPDAGADAGADDAGADAGAVADAGSPPDAGFVVGPPDAGLPSPSPLRLNVGCGCGSTEWLAAGGFLVFLRRRSTRRRRREP